MEARQPAAGTGTLAFPLWGIMFLTNNRGSSRGATTATTQLFVIDMGATWHFRRSAGWQPAWDAIETRKLCLNKEHRKPATSRRSGFTIWRGGGVRVRPTGIIPQLFACRLEKLREDWSRNPSNLWRNIL
jgi:hypothetical protein